MQSGTGAVSMGANKNAKHSRRSSARQILEHLVVLDAVRDDEGRGTNEIFARQVNLLSLRLEFIESKRMVVDSVGGGMLSVNGRSHASEHVDNGSSAKQGSSLESLQRRVTFQSFGESGSPFGAKLVPLETKGHNTKEGDGHGELALTQMQAR